MEATFSIFPKFYRHLGAHELAALVRDVELDTTNVVIRDGYWVTASNLARELPAFMEAMRGEGLDVRFATAGYTAQELIKDPTPLKVMAECGIKEFRLAHFPVVGNDVRGGLLAARDALQRLASLCEKHRIRAVYQLHHYTLVPNPSSAWHVVNGLPAEWIGIEPDPGNQAFEGYEAWDRSFKLLGEYVTALGVKDVGVTRDPAHSDDVNKGWRRHCVPIYEGVTNWQEVMKALEAIGFRGTLVFMPFYDENEPEEMTRKLRREVEYLRKIVESVSRAAG